MAEADGKTCDVFLSYSREDAAFMRRLQGDLQEAGLEVWIDDVGLQAGTPAWESAVAAAIEGARAIVVVLSPAAKGSTWVGRELGYGEERRIPIFPILARGDEQSAVPLRLISNQWVDARTDYLGAVERLRSALLEQLGRESVRTPDRLPLAEADRVSLQGEMGVLGALRRFHQLVADGDAGGALELFEQELSKSLAARGAFATCIEALQRLLGTDLERGSDLDPAARGRVVEELAGAHLAAARPRPADDLLGDAIAAWRRDLAPEVTTSLLTLMGETRILLGELAGADRILSAAARGARESHDARLVARTELATGSLLTYTGDPSGACRTFDAVSASAWELLDPSLEARAKGLRALASWQMGASTPAIQSAQQAWDLAEHAGSPRLRAWSAWLLASVHLSLASITRFRPENLREAQSFLAEAKEICGGHPLPELEADLLLASCRFFRIKGNREMAVRVGEEALELSEQSEYRLKEADCHNCLARLASELGRRDQALRHAAAAYEAARCDGHRYEAALARARQMLEALGQRPAQT